MPSLSLFLTEVVPVPEPEEPQTREDYGLQSELDHCWDTVPEVWYNAVYDNVAIDTD